MLSSKIASSQIVIVGAPTLLETAIVLTTRWGRDSRPILFPFLRSVGAEIIQFNEEHLDAAVTAFIRFGRGRHPAALNFGDCMSYAIAAVAGMPLLYIGEDFSKTDIARA